MLVKSTDTVLKLSGSPKPGEAIRAVLLGRSCLDSNINATIEFHWYKKESNQEQKEHHQKQHKYSERREELHKDEFKIHGATAPIYLVRKVDIGCRIGALVIVRSNISSNDFVHGDEKKKKKSKILATFKSEMSDVVYMESDHVDEDCYADDTPGEGRKIGKNWRLQQKSKTSSTTVAVVETPHSHPHSIGKSFFSSLKVGASPNTFEASAMSGINDEKMNAGKLVFKEERGQIDDDSTIIGAERYTKAENGAISSKRVREEKLLMDAGLSKHKYGSSGRYADDEDNKDESMIDYLLFVEKEEYETTKTKTITKSTERSNKFEDDKIYVDILHKLKAYARMRIRHMGHFLKILKFITFCVLYCTMLYLQTDPILSFEVTSTVKGLLKPRIRSTQDLNYLYEWLSESVVEPIWTEAPCGDGVCSAPYEFPAFGRFGCKADCGSATNIISFVIHIQTRFGNSLAVSALELMSQASWNLCLQDPGRYANDLPDLCWYEKDKKISEVNSNELIRLDIISGNWYIHIKGDHLGLVAGKIYRLEENGDLVLSPSVPLWLTCTKVSLFTNVKARVSTRSSNMQNLTQVQETLNAYNHNLVPRRMYSFSSSSSSSPTYDCSDEKLYGDLEDGYRGCSSITISGRTCQKWSVQSPHSHTRTATNYPSKGLGDHNYCRNPDGEAGGIWCYTTDLSLRWEYCDALAPPPPPSPPPPSPTPPPASASLQGIMYLIGYSVSDWTSTQEEAFRDGLSSILGISSGAITEVSVSNYIWPSPPPSPPPPSPSPPPLLTMMITAAEGSSGFISNDASLSLTFTLSESTSDFTDADVTVTGGGKLTSFTGSGTTYTATLTPSIEGLQSIKVAANAYSDPAGNSNVESNTFGWTYDVTSPTITITAAEGSSGFISNDASLSLTFTLSESTSDFTDADVTVTGGGKLTSFTGSGTTYTATLTPSIEGLQSIKVAANAYSDPAGNSNVESNTFGWTYDTKSPTITITAAEGSSGFISNDASLSLTFTLSESTSDFTDADVTVTGGGKLSSFTGSGTTYTATLTPSIEGLQSIKVAANAYSDPAGNSNVESNTFGWTYDTKSPTITITAAEGSSGFISNDASLSSGTTYTATLTPSIEGLQSIKVAANAYSDPAGNSNVESNTFGWTYDVTSPTITITAGEGSSGFISNDASISLTFTLSESTSDFTDVDVTVTGGGTLSSFTGSGTTYTATLTPSIEGLQSIKVAANAYSDPAGNSNVESNTFGWTYDTKSPTITITAAEGSSGFISNDASLSLAFTLSESTSDFTDADVTVTGGGKLSSFTGSGTTYTATLTPSIEGLQSTPP
ncbi:unnamed protein product [Bathycoccus prasinos]